MINIYWHYYQYSESLQLISALLVTVQLGTKLPSNASYDLAFVSVSWRLHIPNIQKVIKLLSALNPNFAYIGNYSNPLF